MWTSGEQRAHETREKRTNSCSLGRASFYYQTEETQLPVWKKSDTNRHWTNVKIPFKSLVRDSGDREIVRQSDRQTDSYQTQSDSQTERLHRVTDRQMDMSLPLTVS